MNVTRVSLLSHALLIAITGLMLFPIYLAVVASTHSLLELNQIPMPWLPGRYGWQNYQSVLTHGVAAMASQPIWPMLFNSLVMALGIAIGKVVLAMLSAFALVYFDFPFRRFCFGLIFVTLMLPVEVRILPTFSVVSHLNFLDSYQGLILPLLASATATFLFRQYYMTIPKELCEAAKLDGAGPLKFFKDILLPLSKPNLVALFIIMFIYGWNQFLWPQVVTTSSDYLTIVMGIEQLASVADQIPQWQFIMTIAVLAFLPPLIVIVSLQQYFEKGLVDVNK